MGSSVAALGLDPWHVDSYFPDREQTCVLCIARHISNPGPPGKPLASFLDLVLDTA